MIPQENVAARDKGRVTSGAPALAWQRLALGAVIAFSSLAPVQKYAGTAGVLVYVGVVLLAAWFVLPRASTWFAAWLTEKQVLWLTAASLVVLGGLFLVVYPIADAGMVGGGSDRDDNLNAATAELLRGRYPYYVTGYLGNPADILPGGMLLSAPFVVLGNSAYQNFLWLAVFAILARWLFGNGRQALLLWWSLLALAPAVLLELLTGGELISNTVYVAACMLLLVQAVSRLEANGRQAATYAVLLGVTLASRVNYGLLVPVLFSALVQRAGWKPAVICILLALAVFAALTLPFYFYDPAGFSPAHLQNPYTRVEREPSFAVWLVPAITAATALGLAFTRMDADVRALLRNCAIVQMVPLLIGHSLNVLASGRLNLSFGVEGWGLFSLFFGVLAAWPAVLPAPTPDVAV